MIYRQVDLYYQDHRSDKEYHLLFDSNGKGKYQVIAQFGPRGGTLTHVNKTKGWVDYYKASDTFDRTEKEKRSKGYGDVTTTRKQIVTYIKGRSHLPLTTSQWQILASAVEDYIEEYV